MDIIPQRKGTKPRLTYKIKVFKQKIIQLYFIRWKT